MPRSGANDLAQLLGDNVGKAGGSDRRSEGTEQDVGKSGSRVAGEAGREQLHNAVALSSVDGDTTGKTAGNTGDQHGEQNVQPQKVSTHSTMTDTVTGLVKILIDFLSLCFCRFVFLQFCVEQAGGVCQAACHTRYFSMRFMQIQQI